MRRHQFYRQMFVSDGANDPRVDEIARERLTQGMETLTGPRGGRYEPEGETEIVGPIREYDSHDEHRFYVATRWGHYVRPHARARLKP